MANINIAQNILDLRKKKGITQEQLAQEINVSAQAVSKWENDTCQPDTATLVLIAEYFNVSIDYLFYGEDLVYSDIYAMNYKKTASYNQMSAESYEEALKIFASAHNGISHHDFNIKNNIPVHISNNGGLSLVSGDGYGAIVTRKFFEHITPETAVFAASVFSALSDKTNCLVAMAIISMSDISYNEIKEKIGISDDDLKKSLDILLNCGLICEKESKHKSLGLTYEINDMYHTCLCILFATSEILRTGLNGISCCMGYGDYPIKLS